jgi:hypothetical protein
MEKLIMNKAQRHVFSIIKKLWNENRIIRLFILKARQLGISTFIEALIYSLTSQIQNQSAIVIADDLDGSNYIFEMSKLYQEKCPEHLRPVTKKSNEKKLEFDGIHSQILIDTAENKNAGRKYTFRIAHLSEYAFFKDPGSLMLGLSQSVPSMPRTIIIKETTANGFNFAKDEWDKIDEGDSDEIGIFIPWFWGEEYRMKAGDDFIIGDPDYGILTADETMLEKIMLEQNIDFIEERLAWRRWCIKNNCGKGSRKEQVDNFKQEYPSTPEEAFKASGGCFFAKENLEIQLKKYREPLFKGDIVRDSTAGKCEIRKNPEGIYSFWQKPEDGAGYCIGGDACSGSGDDNDALVCRRKDTNEIVATYRGKCDPDDFAMRAAKLGWLYNDADIAIENDKFGFAANKKLKQAYKNIFYQESVNKKTDKKTAIFGWNTTSVTRPLMLSEMQSEIREDSLGLKDKRLMKECLTFITNQENGKVEAQSGCHDDFVIACAISGMVRIMRPQKYTKTQRDTRISRYRALMQTQRQSENAGVGY